ncbi:ATP phosphoribosyltransferase [Alkaliphilus peptidifermentans]|uniref:ATP phosphoribosyltransferase n=1 Tax=Alkaliphilus peptidifermentans DSM 18978 TaxID=1120976 RepID=A0A1G5ADB2_9FIRM|nr:ATP phosphoribosyltransferase [Alkaliphilus peptidifermentans]SCX75863.1 ATP phosphoribosyltransferase catalytic subunit [Alkaliphilus peptidifermentans DSM 18978]
MEWIKIGLAKGRLLEEEIKLLRNIGVDCSVLTSKSRQLVFEIPENNLQVVMLKAPDVPTYVEHGIVDMGIVGKDVLLEQEKQLYEVVDLRLGKCRLSVAGKDGDTMEGKKHLRVATKYPNIAKRYFAEKVQSVEIIKQEGSVELAPILGLSDVILDIVETGNTLRANGLIVMEDVMEISARLVLNKVSYKTKKDMVRKLIERINTEVDKQSFNV